MKTEDLPERTKPLEDYCPSNMDLPKIDAKLKSGNELFTYQGEALGISLFQFWQWSSSDLLSNATRGKMAEFIVAIALGIDFSQPRNEWDAFDLAINNELTIQVKSAAYLQSWFQEDYSSISFSIRPTQAWDADTNQFAETRQRQARLYVFCLLHHKDQSTIDPLCLEQWVFYVISTANLNDALPVAKTISLSRLRQLANPVGYSQLRQAVRLAAEKSL